MSISIRSYLRKNDGSFTDIKSWSGPISDHEYLEGALELTVNDTPLITCDMWDYIDELWAYIINTLYDFSTSNSSHTYFPDQPIRIDLKRTSPEMALISISSPSGKFNKSAFTQEQELKLHLLDSAEYFFNKMGEINPSERDQYEHDISRIKELRGTSSRQK